LGWTGLEWKRSSVEIWVANPLPPFLLGIKNWFLKGQPRALVDTSRLPAPVLKTCAVSFRIKDPGSVCPCFVDKFDSSSRRRWLVCLCYVPAFRPWAFALDFKTHLVFLRPERPPLNGSLLNLAGLLFRFSSEGPLEASACQLFCKICLVVLPGTEQIMFSLVFLPPPLLAVMGSHSPHGAFVFCFDNSFFFADFFPAAHPRLRCCL